MRSRWIVIAIGLLLIAVLAGISVMHLAPEAPHNEPGTPPPPAVSDEIAQAFLNATQADGVANRYAVAEIVNNALQAYYTDHGAYPPYLFGGGAMTGRSFTWMSAENMLRNPDPLISGGYLQEYPRVWYVSGWPRNPGDDGTSDPRGWDHWNCMFSTPGDLLVFSPQCIYLTGQYLLLFGDEPDLEEHADSSPDLRDRVPAEQRRHFALGGLLSYGEPVFSCWPNGEVHPCEDMECLTGDLPCFGYQRGEWLSLGEKECWLWLYGHLALSEAFDPAPETLAEVKQLLATYLPEINEIIAEKKEYCEQHGLDPQEHLGLPDTLFTDYYNPFVIHEARGLDLLNAETGELVPDGIPDGICLLYKLRDGEVVEVMRAEEI